MTGTALTEADEFQENLQAERRRGSRTKYAVRETDEGDDEVYWLAGARKMKAIRARRFGGRQTWKDRRCWSAPLRSRKSRGSSATHLSSPRAIKQTTSKKPGKALQRLYAAARVVHRFRKLLRSLKPGFPEQGGAYYRREAGRCPAPSPAPAPQLAGRGTGHSSSAVTFEYAASSKE